MCAESMRLEPVEQISRIAGTTQTSMRHALEWRCPDCDYFEEAGVEHVVRGTVDCLVPDGDRLLVLEFKTGQPQPSHRRQLALYVDAVRAMAPGTPVHGQLVYATRAETSRPMTAPRLPFDP